MIIITTNTPKHIVFTKDDKTEPWFNHNCSDENLLKQCNRPDDKIQRIQFEDGEHVASMLNIYFK